MSITCKLHILSPSPSQSLFQNKITESHFDMQWPDWLKWPSSDQEKKKNDSVLWSESLNATDWSHYSSPRTIIPTAILTFSTLALIRIYRRSLRRIPDAQYITPSYFHKRSLYGYVSRVGDGDNFRLFHTPGGRATGWGWLSSRNWVWPCLTSQPRTQTGFTSMAVQLLWVPLPFRWLRCKEFSVRSQF